MTYIADRLANLRQEITDLRNMNVLFSRSREHSEVEQSALEVRAHRLLEIKQELSTMLNSPNQPAVWWDRESGRLVRTFKRA